MVARSDRGQEGKSPSPRGGEPAQVAQETAAPVPVDRARVWEEGVVQVPLGAVELARERQVPVEPGALEELAREIWERGLEEPIAVEIVGSEGREVFRLRSGEHRFRAFKLLNARRQDCEGDLDPRWDRYQGYGVIPVVAEGVEGDAALRLLVQMGLEEKRSGLTLYERSQALVEALERSGQSAAAFARGYMGRLRWPVARLRLSSARSVVRIANENAIARWLLECGLLANPEAVGMFARLSEQKQRSFAALAESLVEALSRGLLGKHVEAFARAFEGVAGGMARGAEVVVAVRARWVGSMVGPLVEQLRQEDGGSREDLERVLEALRALEAGGGRVTLELKD
jgi:hypothetical protein